jgi:hypothetical protein
MLSNVEIYSRFARATAMAGQANNTALFNTATKGGLVLEAGNSEGSFENKSSFKRLQGLVRRRNAFGTGNVASIGFEGLEETMVRVAAGTPPVDLTPDDFAWINKDPKEAGVMVGKQLAEETVGDMVNAAVLSLKTALLATAAVYYNYAGTGKLNLLALNSGAAKFGDRAGAIKCWLIHGTPMHDLFAGALTNANQLFKSDTVNVWQDGFGRTFVVTDHPQLANNGTFYTIGLTAGAATVRQNDDFISRVAPILGKENIQEQYQASWSYMMGLKGFKWDALNGGASPNDSALGSSANWDQYAESHKDLPGVIIASQ